MKLDAILAACLMTVQAVPPAPSKSTLSHADSGDTKDISNTLVTINGSETISSNPQRRYAEFITSSGTIGLPITAWPFRSSISAIHQGYLRRIPYCYVDQRSHDKIAGPCRFDNAVQLWADALGGKASRATQHSLVVQGPRNPDDYCCTQYTYGAENQPQVDGELHCVWNAAKYPKDTLAVHWLDDVKLNGRGAVATLGYTAERHDADAGRHWVHVGDVATAANIAHELGHVFGLSHEHQRWDRDEYIEFRCDNLVGMIDAVNGLHEDKIDLDEQTCLDMLCSDRELALEYAAPSADYIKGDGLDPKTRPALDGPGGFDVDSIMMYSSMAGSYAPENQANIDDAVLVKIQKDSMGKKTPARNWRIPTPMKVSSKDAAFIRQFYAWDEDKAQHHIDSRRRRALDPRSN